MTTEVDISTLSCRDEQVVVGQKTQEITQAPANARPNQRHIFPISGSGDDLQIIEFALESGAEVQLNVRTRSRAGPCVLSTPGGIVDNYALT